ncbi:HAMP domain-containing sensor histidine kinase [Nannocystis pusilla]|uniref:histidine kinase n=1 Tax=Nannocystis pusilla TaxID=889268 RepID=A0A9X3IYW8_9BACT|nr:HAMP domain-containing sensor histidine kinase [Nannocystis pusilla]
MVAHELRQPVQVIHACARTIARVGAGERDPLTAKSAARILAAAGRLERMIKDLLDAARIEARQLSLRSESIDVEAVLAEVVARIAESTERSLRLDVAPGLPRVRGDAGRVEQIAENLLTNALKYGDPGGPIVVEVRPHGHEVMVSTINQGQRLLPAEIDCLLNDSTGRARSRRSKGWASACTSRTGSWRRTGAGSGSRAATRARASASPCRWPRTMRRRLERGLGSDDSRGAREGGDGERRAR